jgi:hypothetical protein
VTEIRKAMTQLDTVYAQHQAAINSIGRATMAVDDVKEAVVRPPPSARRVDGGLA